MESVEVKNIVQENALRQRRFLDVFNPITGEGCLGRRFPFKLSDFNDGRTIFLPVSMLEYPLVVALSVAGSIEQFCLDYYDDYNEELRDTVLHSFLRKRAKEDFCFFSYAYALIKNKDGGDDIPFLLRPAQRKLVAVLEDMRLDNQPIRIILLKCRQWGGSTTVQIYMAWIQLFWKKSMNSLIVGHQSDSSVNVKLMYLKLIKSLPDYLFHEDAEPYKSGKKIISGGTQNISLIPSRNARITTGSAMNPESARGSDEALVHCTEVAFWQNSEKTKPQDVVKSACSGVSLSPLTMIAYESTPNGSENYYKDEWDRANAVDQYGNAKSIFRPVFVSWFEIEDYQLRINNVRKFAEWLYDNRNVGQGKYLWWLWQKGATLEGIKWYYENAKTYADPDDMKQEYPSDDIEAFKYSGKLVFSQYDIHELEADTREPVFEGSIYGDDAKGKGAVTNIRIKEQKGGELRIWEYPEDNDKLLNRYFASLDIGGKHKTSDYSCLTVFDRYDTQYGGRPKVVAEWYGHCDPDILAITCAQVCIYYHNALFIPENNTAYSRMNDTDGNINDLFFPILVPLYDNIFLSHSPGEAVRENVKAIYGFSTNSSSKPSLVLNLNIYIRDHLYLEPDKQTLVEYYTYMKYPNGSYGAIKGKHDDKLMSRAIGLYVLQRYATEYPLQIIQERKPSIPHPLTAATVI